MRTPVRRSITLVAAMLVMPLTHLAAQGGAKAPPAKSTSGWVKFAEVTKEILPGVEYLLSSLFSDAPANTYFIAEATMLEVSWTLRRTSFNWFDDQTFDFDMVLRGPFSSGGVSGTADYWKVHTVANEQPAAGIDQIVLDGFVQHMIDPHSAEHALRPKLDWHFLLDTQTPTRMPDGTCQKTASTTKKALHPGGKHEDTMDKNEVVATVGCAGANDFYSYYQNGHAFHPEDPTTTTPEPATIALLAAGLLCLALAARVCTTARASA